MIPLEFADKLFRSALLSLAGNRAAEAFALKYGLRLGAHKFVAGETLTEALEKIQRLNDKGIAATLDHLGEGVTRISEADSFREEYSRLLIGIRESKADCNVSLKPTQMGLAIDPGRAYDNIKQIVKEARSMRNFVRIDMEDSAYTDDTINIVRRLHAEGYLNVGTVIQAYLFRTEKDIRRLSLEKVNLRLVKGAYKEPKTLAFARMEDVNANFREIIAARLRSGIYTGVATHDEAIIDWVKSFVKEQTTPYSSFEFQMLYGIRTQLQETLAKEGYRVRCYVPYGRMWYPYFVRRLAERPANVLFILKNMIKH
ncbi:proline dehydrogenase family protein [Cohnella lupini]|uniref:proline dehydrogenase n=1 Tax=Cohnella lupini TaxID=1294267 RepID=A0A3D9I7K8_9BACL|nr:proline dehydrogenase family protein [Cohnella lupini]RED57156.1 L-proline dehydrogenase [Cohnella lupini]